MRKTATPFVLVLRYVIGSITSDAIKSQSMQSRDPDLKTHPLQRIIRDLAALGVIRRPNFWSAHASFPSDEWTCVCFNQQTTVGRPLQNVQMHHEKQELGFFDSALA